MLVLVFRVLLKNNDGNVEKPDVPRNHTQPPPIPCSFIFFFSG